MLNCPIAAMLDPFTALTLASAIVQFIDFSATLISTGREIRSNGSIVDAEEMETVTKDLSQLAKGIQVQSISTSASASSIGGDERALLDVANGCNQVATELLRALGPLTSKAARKKWETVRMALRAVWSKSKIDDLSRRLQGFREELMLRVVVSLRAKEAIQATLHDERFGVLNDNDQKILKALVQGNSDIAISFEAHTERTNDLIKELFEAHDKKLNHKLDETQDSNLRHFEKIIATTERTNLLHQVENLPPLINSSSYRIAAQTAQLAREAVLEHLWFRQITARHDAIAEAHAETFEWVFRPDLVEDPWDDLSQWLATGSGCYWINGKAASGKSTLMKYIVHHPKTRSTLLSWSQGKDVITPSFFFWNPGTDLQKSQTGLIRAILYEVLSRCRIIIPQVFPELYGEEARQLQKHKPSYQVQPLSDLELKMGFMKLLQCFPNHVCFFIDGIDEFTGDHAEMSSMLLSFASRPNIKLVVSSRPVPACRRFFTECPNLRLEDLTRDDIEKYVNIKIRTHQRMQELLIETPDEARELVDQIVSIASGVFLWVRLVVTLLIDGLENYDRISDLRRRLETLPPELGDLYKHMLSTMQPLYRQQASQYLQVASQCKEIEKDSLTLLRLSYADEDDLKVSLRLPDDGLTSWQIWGRCRATHGRLLSRCCGLLEVTGNLAPTARVTFLHKTVTEFLNEDDIRAYMLSLTAETSFDANISLLSSALAMLKLSRNSFKVEERDNPWIATPREAALTFLQYCRLAEMSISKSQLEYIKELERVMALDWPQSREPQGPRLQDHVDSHWYSAFPEEEGSPSSRIDSFVSLIASHGLYLSLDQLLSTKPLGFLDTSGRRFLIDAIESISRKEDLDAAQTHFMVLQTLLRYGAKPNQSHLEKQSPWELAIFHLRAVLQTEDLSRFPEQQLIACEILELFVEYGAGVKVFKYGDFRNSEATVDFMSIARFRYARRAGAEPLFKAIARLNASMEKKGVLTLTPGSQTLENQASEDEATVPGSKSVWNFFRRNQ